MQRDEATRAIDPRPARTRAAIYAAVESLATGPDGDVTVNGIVRVAGVSRGAFYSQFSDLDDLAVSMLVDAFRDIGVDDVRARLARDGDPRTLARRSIERLVGHIGDRSAFYRASLEWRLSSRVHETVVAAFAAQVFATMQVLGDGVPSDADHEDIAKFIAGGAVTILAAWLREDPPSQRERLVQRLLAVMPAWLVGSG